MLKAENVERKWHYIDASGKTLGRLAKDIAIILIGKDKAGFVPNQNLGDKVVVTNAEKVVVTGNKLKDKIYNWYTGFPGGLRSETLGNLMKRKPTEALIRAVRGMLPKNRLQEDRMKNLYVYEGPEHPHKGQVK